MTNAQTKPAAIQPYLFFDGRCEEAIEFYKSALGAEVVMMMRFSENPEPQPGMTPPGDKIMHACLSIHGAQMMMSDGMCSGDNPVFGGVSISLAVPDETEADRVFAALSEGGQVQMPIGPTFFSPRFGMAADRFGVSWMVSVAAPEEGAAA